MRPLIAAFFASLALAQPMATMAQEKPPGRTQLVTTTEIAANLSVGQATERVTGRVSFHLLAGASRDEVVVRGFNVVFFGVSQKLIAGRARIQEPLGVLAFGLARDKPQALRYDAGSRRLSGELQMFADASFLSLLARPAADGKGDSYDTPTLPATARLVIELAKPLAETQDEYERIAGTIDLRLTVGPMRYREFEFPRFEIRPIEPLLLRVDIAPLVLFEAAHRLCIQPVRLLRLVIKWSGWFPFISFNYSGAGLGFGEPGARTEWAKNDIVFDIRGWKTLAAGAFWQLGEGEAGDLRSQVDDDDCIETFFVNSLNPNDLWGGGATFGSGTASAQIISTDANARGGVDLTHLAHELGHVLGLRHPGAAATASAVAASTGTLMCPSGFLRDNPRVNSQENEDLLSNPLLIFTLKLRSAGPDCQESADCGACP